MYLKCKDVLTCYVVRQGFPVKHMGAHTLLLFLLHPLIFCLLLFFPLSSSLLLLQEELTGSTH